MSEALDYLLKVRKDAIEPYFQFLKEGGKHLDDKTRSLLSVITKVDAKTEAGLKQYLKRALKQGNTADEILDAMLVCIPTLGFSKIIWAIDIIIKMDLPEFKETNLVHDKQSKDHQWHKIISIGDIKEDVLYQDFDGKSYFITKNDNGFQVFDTICPHKTAKIPCDAIDGMQVECPMHHWKFNLQTGESLEEGNYQPLNKIKSKVEDNTLYIYL